MLKKVLFSLLLGMLGALYVAQNDQWVHDVVVQKLKPYLQQAWNSTINFEVEEINLFAPAIVLKNVHCYPKNALVKSESLAWVWHAQRLTLTSSWITFLLSSLAGLTIEVEQLKAFTSAHGDAIPLLHEHIFAMIAGASSDVPLYVKALSFKNGELHVHHLDSGIDSKVIWSSQSYNTNGAFNSYLWVHDGQIMVKERMLFSALQGNGQLKFTQTVKGLQCDNSFDLEADFHITPHETKPCTIQSQWHTNQGTVSLVSLDQTIQCSDAQMAYDDRGFVIQVQLKAPLAAAASFLTVMPINQALTGSCTVDAHAVFSQRGCMVQGNAIAREVQYDSTSLCETVTTRYSYENNMWRGKAVFRNDYLGELNGSWQWDMLARTGHIQLHPNSTIAIPGYPSWKVPAKKCACTVRVNSDGHSIVEYTALATHQGAGTTVASQGKISLHEGIVKGSGHVNQCPYEYIFSISPHFAIKKITYANEQEVPLIDLKESDSGSTDWNGSIDLGFLRSLSNHLWHYTVQGEGKLSLKGKTNGKRIEIETALHDGVIRLPETYNFINQCTATIIVDGEQRALVVRDLYCGLYRGVIKSPHMVFKADESYSLEYAYAPLAFESCLLNVKKDFFALFSGTLAISKKKAQMAQAQGALFIERSYIKENIYSPAFQKAITGFTGFIVDADQHDMDCDITIESKDPVRVDTAFLQASAKIALRVVNTIRNPMLSGSIDIVSGSLSFPYKPLMITKGSIYFMPDHVFDPIIELTAKNKIKKYTIGLQVTGSFLNHHIALESSPALTDEQIIALLLVGSQEQSLNVIMPALLMQNLKSMLLGSEREPGSANNFFKSWLKPFKNITLVPSFSDQTGRGGLRGTIEIEINDRLRAMAQKNFSLSEDTRFEVEYELSDDVMLRGIRNERKDVATEVEMRWKFGK